VATSGDLVQVLRNSIDALKDTIRDAQSKSVAPETLSNLVELATLRVFSVLETFLQELFYLCMLKDGTVSGQGAVIAVSTREEADLLLLTAGARREKYLSWLPLDRTLDLAETFLLESHPFDRLRYRQTEKRAVDELTIVRNAVAHPSDHARAEFVILARSKGYPTIRAADYLLSTRGGNQEILLLMTRVELIAAGLAAASDLDADGILEAESQFQAQAKAPKGLFECVRCGNQVVQAARGKLGACRSCEPIEACSCCGKMPTPTTTWRRVLVPAQPPS
jgi:hypothetical protein